MGVCGAIQGRHSFRSNDWHADCMILPKVRDPRLVTIRRGGTLTDPDHQLLAPWAAPCAEHVLHFFEDGQPSDTRPRDAIEAARAWAREDMKMMDARARGGNAMGAARPLVGAARYAAYAAGQAACVGHVPEHDLGAAAYAIKAARAAHPRNPSAGRVERNWQRDRLPGADSGACPRGPGPAQRDLLVRLRGLTTRAMPPSGASCARSPMVARDA